jgi:hypothetical protein
MKRLFVAAVILLLLVLLYDECKAEKVEEGTFPEDRIIDVRPCMPLVQDKHHFLYCVNIEIICKDKIVQEPIGEFYGYRIQMPYPKGNTYIWVDELWKSELTDTDTKAWCTRFHENLKKKMNDDLKNGKVKEVT